MKLWSHQLKSIDKSQKLNIQDKSFSRRHECFTTCGSLGSLPPLQISRWLNKLEKNKSDTGARRKPSAAVRYVSLDADIFCQMSSEISPAGTACVDARPPSDVVRPDTGLCHTTSSTFSAFREACFIFNEATTATSPQKLAKMSGHNAPKRLKSIF